MNRKRVLVALVVLLVAAAVVVLGLRAVDASMAEKAARERKSMELLTR